MTEEKQDRRSRRTREALIHALLALLETRPYDQITVQDVIQRADVGRSTFYAHYQHKDDLLFSGFEHILDMLAQRLTVDDAGQLFFDTSLLFQHATGHYEIYRRLVWGSGFKLLITDGHAVLSLKIERRLQELLATRPEPPIPLPVLSATLAGGVLVLLKWWLDQRMPYPPERMDAAFQQLIMPGVRAALT